MDAGAVILIILFFVVMLVIGITFLAIRFYKFPKKLGTKLVFEDTSKTKGSAIADLLNKKVVNKRLILTCLPLDRPNPKPFMYIAEPSKMDIRPKGTWMADSDAIRIFPNTVEEWATNQFQKLELINAQSTIEKAQRMGLDRQAAHLKNMAEGEASREDMALQETTKQLLVKSHAEEKKPGRSGGYVNPASFPPRDILT